MPVGPSRLAVLATTGLTAVALASPAPAQTIVDKSVEVPNCNTNGQLCPPKVGTQFLATQGFVKVEFTANPNHCSDIAAIMSFDDDDDDVVEITQLGANVWEQIFFAAAQPVGCSTAPTLSSTSSGSGSY